MQRPKFKFLTGDVNYLAYGGKWISKKFHAPLPNPLDKAFDYYFVFELENVEECIGEREAKEVGFTYWSSLYMVAPEIFEDKDGALKCSGNDEPWDEIPDNWKVELIHSYGGGARVGHEAGNNYKKLFKEARETAAETVKDLKASLDGAQNQLGSRGWDFLKGDVVAGARRYFEEGRTDDPTKNLFVKIAGSTLYG